MEFMDKVKRSIALIVAVICIVVTTIVFLLCIPFILIASIYSYGKMRIEEIKI